jgi:hypothetical protein
MNRLDRLVDMSQENEDLGAATKLFRMANANLYLAFHPVQEE